MQVREKIFLREGSPADAELIAAISQRTFYDSFAAYNTVENMEKFLSEQFTLARLMLEVGRPENTFLLAFQGDEVAGYVKLRDYKKPEALKEYCCLEVARFYAVKEMIGKGVGHKMMERTIEIAQRKEKEMLWLGVWEKNQRAIDFYTKWGFEKFGECDFLLGDDVQNDWLMKKKL